MEDEKPKKGNQKLAKKIRSNQDIGLSEDKKVNYKGYKIKIITKSEKKEIKTCNMKLKILCVLNDRYKVANILTLCIKQSYN